MIGMNRITGKPLGGEAHLAQSIRDILTTPIGSRVMRRDYGSRLPDLIDSPINGQTVIEFYVATFEALDAWEPRISLSRVRIDEAAPAGRLALSIEYFLNDAPAETGVVIEGRAA
ncbi:MAG: GPW/gp25 family protein [Pseudomonadota bacterium]